jgi:hypothetical protein
MTTKKAGHIKAEAKAIEGTILTNQPTEDNTNRAQCNNQTRWCAQIKQHQGILFHRIMWTSNVNYAETMDICAETARRGTQDVNFVERQGTSRRYVVLPSVDNRGVNPFYERGMGAVTSKPFRDEVQIQLRSK